MSETPYHIPALLPEALAGLDLKPDGVYVDATFGGGGHSRGILGLLGPEGHLYSFDQDEDAMAGSIKDDGRFTFVYSNFRYLKNFMRYHGVERVDGILADLGVSFHHFDDETRGFSFRWSGPLDMRMNRRSGQTAASFLAEASESRIADALYLYGEVKASRRIASAIVREREVRSIETSERFLEIVRPFVNQRQEKKELAMIYQALRIEVNGELDALKEFLNQAVEVLRPGGRLAVITYHSLEDRIVKNFMKTGNAEGKEERDEIFGSRKSPLKMLTSKPVVASEAETEANPRSRSAKLRIAEKI